MSASNKTLSPAHEGEQSKNETTKNKTALYIRKLDIRKLDKMRGFESISAQFACGAVLETKRPCR